MVTKKTDPVEPEIFDDAPDEDLDRAVNGFQDSPDEEV